MLRYLSVGGVPPTEEELLAEARYTGAMIAAAKDVCGRDEERLAEIGLTAAMIAAAKESPSSWIEGTTQHQRAQDVNVIVRVAFAMSVMKAQREAGLMMLPPCTWCGQPTGCYCDECYERGRRGRAICSYCDEKMPGCRMCFPLETYPEEK